jgi:hypothetical protein
MSAEILRDNSRCVVCGDEKVEVPYSYYVSPAKVERIQTCGNLICRGELSRRRRMEAAASNGVIQPGQGDGRSCRKCGAALTRRANETPGNFLGRVYCDRNCYLATFASMRFLTDAGAAE